MLGLLLFTQAASGNLLTHLLASSCRPAILTYVSCIVDAANPVPRIPLYMLG